jgi:phosphoglycolate phosphatase
VTGADLVIFDLDGTLVDTAPDIAGALGAALAGAGVAAPPLDVVKQLVGDGARALIHRALGRAPAAPSERDIDAALARFLAHYRAHVSDRSVVYDGIEAALAALAAAGVAAAVVTNKPGDIARRLLAALGLPDRFRAVIGDGDGHARKPDPAAARAVIALCGARPERTAVVGDGVPDVRMARAAGARAIGVAWGYGAPERLEAEGADAIVATAAELVAMVVA